MKDNTNTFLKSTCTYLYILLCAFFMSLNAPDNLFRSGYSYADSAVFQYVARAILNGGMPYRDTFDHKGPLLYLIDVLGMSINKQFGIWVIELVSIVLIFIFMYHIARLVGCGRLASCVVITLGIPVLALYFEGGNLSEEYACVFITLSMYIFLKYFESGRVRPYELVLCGASFAAVCLLRINMIALWVVMCIGVLIERIAKKKTYDLIRYTLWFIAGALLITCPILLWLKNNGALQSFFDDYIAFNFAYSSHDVRASLTNKIYSLYTFGTNGVVAVSAALLGYFAVLERKEWDILVLFTLALSLLMIAISGQTFQHYGIILYPLITFSICRFIKLLESYISGTICQKDAALIVSALLLYLILSLHGALVFARNIKNNTAEKSDTNHAIAEVIDNYTEVDDAITVCGNRDIIYLLSDRVSASKYSYQSPIADVSPQIKEEYLSDLWQLRAKMIVVEKDGFLYRELTELLTKHYTLIDTVSDTEIYLLVN